MNEECLICGKPLIYLEHSVSMVCDLCGKEEQSRVSCSDGHYVCGECHMNGLASIVGVCMHSSSRNPVEILNAMMSLPFCHVHGPEHHIMAGASLLTAYRNAGGDIELMPSLSEMIERGKDVPGGSCGYWGACGAGISAGIFVSIITHSDPLTVEPFRLSNLMTSRVLEAIGNTGGPRCCKRSSYMAVKSAVEFVRDKLGVDMEMSEIACDYSRLNNQCIGTRCPFHKS